MRGIHHTCRRPAIFAALALTDNGSGSRAAGTMQRAKMESVSPVFSILVADDSEDAVESLAMLLEFEGHQVVIALDGDAALAAAERVRPQIAILDIGMPGATGYEVAQRIREAPWGRGMLLIAATGWGQEADIRHSMEAGFDAHLTKPLNVGRIKSLIEEIGAQRKSS